MNNAEKNSASAGLCEKSLNRVYLLLNSKYIVSTRQAVYVLSLLYSLNIPFPKLLTNHESEKCVNRKFNMVKFGRWLLRVPPRDRNGSCSVCKCASV